MDIFADHANSILVIRNIVVILMVSIYAVYVVG